MTSLLCLHAFSQENDDDIDSTSNHSRRYIDSLLTNYKQCENFVQGYERLSHKNNFDIFYSSCIGDISKIKIDTSLREQDTLFFINRDSSIVKFKMFFKDNMNFYNDSDFMYNFQNLLLSGTTNESINTLSKKVDSIFIDYDIRYDKFVTSFYRKDREEAFKLIFDIIQNSIFSSRDIEFKILDRDFSYSDFDLFYNTCVYDRGYDILTPIDENLLNNTEYYKKYWETNNQYFIIQGDISRDEIEKSFHTLKIKKSNSAKVQGKIQDINVKNQEGTLIHFLDKKKSERSKIIISSFSNEKPSQKEKQVAKIYSEIFRDIYIDEKQKIFLDFNDNKGIVLYSTFSPQKVTDEKLVKIEELFKNLTINGFADYIDKNFLEKYLYYYEQDSTVFTKEYQIDFFKKFIFNKNFRILLIGNAIEVAPMLENKGYNIVFIDDSGQKINKPKFVLPIEKNIDVIDVVDKYFNSLGGVKNISAIYSLEKSADVIIDKNVFSLIYKAKKPNRYVSTIYDKDGNIYYKKLFNYSKGYVSYDTITKIFTIEEIHKLRSEKVLFPLLDYAKAKELKLVEKEPLNGIWCYKLKIRFSDDKVTYAYISENDYTKLKEEVYDISEEGEEKLSYYIHYSDFKKIDEIIFPFREEVFDSEKKLMDIKINQIKLNVDFDNQTFK